MGFNSGFKGLNSYLFNCLHCTNIYSNWIGEQFCYLSSNTLYKSVKENTQEQGGWRQTRKTECT